jgi:hypothetical protein
MPDHLGSDQRKVKEENKEDKPIQGNCTLLEYVYNLCAYSLYVSEMWVGY